MPSRLNPPAIPARFRKKEFDRLFAGLKIIVCERAGFIANGHTKNDGWWRVMPHRRPPGACFDRELMDRVLDLWSRLYPLGQEEGWQSRRLNFDELQIRALTLGLRMLRHQESRRHTATSSPSAGKARSRLRRKLGRLQRQASRAWMRSELASLHPDYQARWKKFDLWVRLEFGCLCQQPPIMRQRRRPHVERGIEVAKQALAEADFEAPGDKQIRRFVRLAFREIRRGRQPFCIADILHGGQRARLFLAFFIRERLRRNGTLKFFSTT